MMFSTCSNQYPPLWSAVHNFAASGDVDSIKQLNPSEITVLTDKHETALHIASQFGQVHVVTYLIDNYPTMLERISENGNSVLHIAAIYKQTCVLEKLMLSCSYDEPNERGRTPLQEAIVVGFFDGIIIMLNCRPEWLTTVDNRKRTLLHFAIEYDQMTILILFLTLVPKDMLLAQDNVGDTPLSIAVYQDSLSMVKLLYHANPAAVHISNSNDMTPFLRALAFDYVSKSIMEFLMERNQRVVEAKTENGCTAFHLMNDVEIAKKILVIKPDLIYALNDEGQNALHCASWPDYIRFLIETEPHLLDDKDINGHTPFYYAANTDRCDILDTIIQCKPDLNDTDQTGNTVLHVAVEQCNNESVTKAFENRISNLYCVNNSGDTPFHVAAMTKNIFALHLFKNHVTVEMIVETRNLFCVKELNFDFGFDLQSSFFLHTNSLHDYILPELVDIVYEYLDLPKTKKRKRA